jgi:hypothetical protein
VASPVPAGRPAVASVAAGRHADEASKLYDKYGMLRSQALTPEATKRLLEKLGGET